MKGRKEQMLKVGAVVLLIVITLIAAQSAGSHLAHAVEKGGFHYGQVTLFGAVSVVALVLLAGVIFNAIPATSLLAAAFGAVLLFLWLLPKIMGGGRPPGS